MLYQHTMSASKCNAFCWDDGRHSIFVDTGSFKVDRNGEDRSTVRSRSVRRAVRETGKNPGTLRGISRKGDRELHGRRG